MKYEIQLNIYARIPLLYPAGERQPRGRARRADGQPGFGRAADREARMVTARMGTGFLPCSVEQTIVKVKIFLKRLSNYHRALLL